MKTIYLVRHGRTSWNDDGRIQGWSHIGLDDRGRQQARNLATYLADEHPGIEAIYASDLPRAVETAEIIAAEPPFSSLTVQSSEAWRERDFGAFQGFSAQDFFQEYPEYAVIENGRNAALNCPAFGESYAEFDERVRDAWSTFFRTTAEPESCLVTHSGVIRQIVAHIEGFDYATAIQDVHLENCSLTRISYDPDADEHAIEASNECDFL